jgi:hypothetical protein
LLQDRDRVATVEPDAIVGHWLEVNGIEQG